MKRLLFIALLFCGVSMNAQEKAAQKIVNEMTEVLDLSKEDSEKVYAIAFERIKNTADFRKEHPDMDKAEMKKNINKFNKKFGKELEQIIGPDKKKKWQKYRNNKQKK